LTTITPRIFQSNGIFKLREKILFGKKRIILMAPTGAGKGFIMAMLTQMGLSKGSDVLTVLYGSDLIRQTEKNYKRYYNIDSQIIMGSVKSPPEKTKIASISTLHRRNLPDADFIIVDECHQSKSPTYRKIFEHYQDKIIIGLSATPFNNLDNFEDCIVLATVKELIALKFLVQPKHFAPKTKVNTDGLKIVKGEWEDKDLEREALKITGDAIAEWKLRAHNRQTVVFCVNVNHSLEMAKAFNDEGIKAVHIDGETPAEIRDQAIDDIKSGAIQVICNVMVFSTGIDCPEIACVVMLRPTHSEILYCQQIGRGLRPAPNKKDCIVIDHANNVSRFGLSTDDRLPVITAPEKKKSSKKLGEVEIKIWVCTFCYCTNYIKDTHCMECKEARPVKEKKLTTEDGELQEITESKKKNTKIFLGDVMPFGKHRGTAFEFLPYQYIEWGSSNLDNKDGLQMRFKVELQRRNA
jgi:superfamily II DNA or RNA helicase